MEQALTVEGRQRGYLLHVPAKSASPAPLLLALHGGGGDAEFMQRLAQFDPLADREGFIVAYPAGVEGRWNDGREEAVTAAEDRVDDVGFLRAVVDDVVARYAVDLGRVFIAGISNGGFMAHRMAAEAADVVAGAASVVGGMATSIGRAFAPAYPVSILIIQSDADPIIPIAGGAVGMVRGKKRGEMLSTQETLELYLERNRIQGPPAVTTIDQDAADNISVERFQYPVGPGGVKAEYYLVRGGGHNWPGPTPLPRNVTKSKIARDISATEVIWEFFRTCPARTLKGS